MSAGELQHLVHSIFIALNNAREQMDVAFGLLRELEDKIRAEGVNGVERAYREDR